VRIEWFESELFEREDAAAHLEDVNGILVPGGFGERGFEGKIVAVRYARENNVPYLGICYGMHAAMVEFARNVAGIADANSTEVAADTPNPVIGLVTEWVDREGQVEQRNGNEDFGGTMRLGAQTCLLSAGSIAREVYGSDQVEERHRHRYEVNNEYMTRLEQLGMRVAGRSGDGSLVEMIEVVDHPWFVACQFHPEFTSSPLTSHPLFKGFIGAALTRQTSRASSESSRASSESPRASS
jgi:CTP synthase